MGLRPPLSTSLFSGMAISQDMSTAMGQRIACNNADLRNSPMPSCSMHDIMTAVCADKDDGGELLGAYRISSHRVQQGVPGRHSPHHTDLLMILKVGVEDAPLLKRVSYSCTSQAAVMTRGPNQPPAQSVPSSEHHLPPGEMSLAPPAEPMLLQRQWSCKPQQLLGPAATPPLPETQPELSPEPFANSPSGLVCVTPPDYLPIDAAPSALAAEHRGPPSAEHSRCTLSAEHSAPLSAEQSSRCTVSSSSSGSAAALLHTHAGNASSECSSSRASSAEILWDGAMHYLLETDAADMWMDALMRSGAEQLLLRAGSSSCFTGPAPAGGEQLLLRAGRSSCFTGPAPDERVRPISRWASRGIRL